MFLFKEPFISQPVQDRKIEEYPELEGTHKDYQIKLLAPYITTQNSNPVFENTVWMLLELWQCGAVPTALGRLLCLPPSGVEPFPNSHSFSGKLFQCLTTLNIKNFFLICNLNLPSFSLKLTSLVLFLQALVKKKNLIFFIFLYMERPQ